MGVDKFVVTLNRNRSQLYPPEVDTPKRIPVEDVIWVDDLKATEKKLYIIIKGKTYLKNEVNKIKNENRKDKLEKLEIFYLKKKEPYDYQAK